MKPSKPKRHRLAWRKVQNSRDWLDYRYDLHLGSEILAVVKRSPTGGWYFYTHGRAGGVNQPFYLRASIDETKAIALACVQKFLAESKARP